MNTDDKAKELVEKFKYYAYVDWHGGDNEMTQEEAAKQCAIICVEEIMNNILPIGAKNGTERSQEIYWQEVKSKILCI